MNIEPERPNSGREPPLTPTMLQLGEVVYRLLNRSLTEESHLILGKLGRPLDDRPSVGEMLEMIAAPELPLLEKAPPGEQSIWQDWVARLITVYRHYAASEHFLMDRSRGITFIQFLDIPMGVDAPAMPFARSDFAILAESERIAGSMGAHLGGWSGDPLGCAFRKELDRCAQLFERIGVIAGDAQERAQS